MPALVEETFQAFFLFCFVFCLFVCFLVYTNIYSFIVIINSTTKYKKHESSMLISVLPIDNMIITDIYDGKMANCC